LPSRLRVPLGYLAAAALLVLARPDPRSLLLGLLPALAGACVRLWAAGHIEKTRALATGGPYAHTRNPLYLGSVLMALGLAAAAASPWCLALLLLYLAAFYPAVMREEAAFLRGRFPAEYAAWAAAVPAFLPRLTPGGPRATRFSWARVLANREWRALAGLFVAVALLYLRSRWPA
jgi:protein-S-isoprenylcysteine O-methyltransferase Ste14